MSVEVPIQGAVEEAESYVSAAAYASEQSSSSTTIGEDSGGQSNPMSVEAPLQGGARAHRARASMARGRSDSRLVGRTLGTGVAAALAQQV